jgi:predicted nucleic acid-binding protein
MRWSERTWSSLREMIPLRLHCNVSANGLNVRVREAAQLVDVGIGTTSMSVVGYRMASAFVDTNVLIHAMDEDEPRKQRVALELLDRLAGEAVLSTQVLQEFFVVSTRKLSSPLPEEEAQTQLRDLAELPTVNVDSELVLAGIALSRSARLSLWDALIVCAARAAECSVLYSEDLNAGQPFENVRIVDPFAVDKEKDVG